MPYNPTIYLGSADHYRYGRPAYSPELEAFLTQQAGLDGNGRLLDVGCGPGVVTVRLAHLFTQAIGLDPDAGMLAEGRRAAEERTIVNIQWVQGLAEDLPAAAPGPYRLVTFGQSFHWTDEQRVAETVYDMLINAEDPRTGCPGSADSDHSDRWPSQSSAACATSRQP